MNRMFLIGALTLLVGESVAGEVPQGWLLHAPTGKVGVVTKFAGEGSSNPIVADKPKLRLMANSPGAKLLTAAAAQPSLTTYLPQGSNARVAELARGLHYDWLRCFDFVRNHVRFTPYPGFIRGPERTLIDMEGNDADQAYLLLALLRASGYANSKLIYLPWTWDSSGTLTSGFMLSNEDSSGYGANDWLRISEAMAEADPSTAAYVMAYAGRPVSRVGESGLTTDHYWVQLTVDGNDIVLDPSLKADKRQSPESMKVGMQYERSSFISNAGGTVGSYSVQNLAYANVSTKLESYMTSLSKQEKAANLSAADFIGDSHIVPRKEKDAYFHGTTWGTGVDVFAQASSYVNAMRTLMTVKLNGTSLSQFYLDEIGSRNLWLSYQDSGSSACTVRLNLDNQVLATRSNVAKGKATLTIAVAHSEVPSTHDYALEVAPVNVHSIIVGFDGDVSDGMRKIAVQKLAEARDRKLANNSAEMLSLSTFNAGHQWLAQTHLIKKMRNRILNGTNRDYYEIGIAGQSGGPYVDVANATGHGYFNYKHFTGSEMFVSALEHSIIEQLNGPEVESVSTVKLLSLANAAGIPVCFITKNNVSSAVGSLKNYTSSQLSEIRNTASDDYYVLVPQDGNIVLNKWKGAGYVTFGPISSSVTSSAGVGMYISGGYNGGYSSKEVTPNADGYFDNSSQSYYGNGAVNTSTQSDPIAMPYGAFLDRVTDLELNRQTPLRWVRSYDSRGRLDAGGLGRGWSHGFDASIVETTDMDAFFSRGSVDAVLPTVVALTVVDDLLADQETLSAGENARRWTLAALVVQWWSDRLCRNAVSVKLGAQMLGFTKRADGSFAPAPGVTATLTAENGGYVLRERNGNSYTFNADKRLSKLTDMSGNVTTLTYADGKLTRVSNGFDAAFDLTWKDGRIASVSDTAGRTVAYSYDAASGCLTGVKDVRGKSWTMAYDPQNFALTRTVDPDGQVTLKNVYNAMAQVTNQTSAVGGVTTLGYVASRGGWDRDSLGNVLEQEYDESGRSILRIERDGALTSRSYDGHGHVVSEVDALGMERITEYDGRDNVVALTEGSGNDRRTTTMAYDAKDRLVQLTDALGNVTAFAYDSCGRIVKQTRPDGTCRTNVWTDKGLLSETCEYSAAGHLIVRKILSYNAYGLPVSSILTGDGLPVAGIVESIAYNAQGLPSSTTDANGNVTTLAYDAAGHLLSATDALGRMVTRSYTSAGYMASSKDALGHETRYTVTPSGKIATIKFADGGVVSRTFDLADNLVSFVSTRGTETDYGRDEMGRPVRVQTPLSYDTIKYDLLGNPVESANAASEMSRLTYDSLSRLVATENGVGSVWKIGYDADDRAVSTTSPLGKTTRNEFDSRGRKISTVKPSGRKDTFGYDAAGNWASYVNAEGGAYTRVYDAAGRMTSATNVLGHCVMKSEYDGAGNLVRRTDGEGNVLAFAYDAANRLVSRKGTGIDDAFEYDAADNVTKAKNDLCVSTFGYDVRNRLTSADVSVGGKKFALAWQYDLGGLVTRVAYESGKTVQREYDADGRLVKVTDWLGHIWRFSYDGAGKITGIMSPDGVDAVCSYDAAGQLKSWSVDGIAGRSITRDAAGRRIKDEITTGSVPSPRSDRASDFEYNAADQLIAAKIQQNGTTVQAVCRYDGNGSLIETTAEGGVSVSLAYAADGTLTSVQKSASTASYGYDALGNRIAADGKYWIPDYADALKRPLVECDAAGAVLRYYIWADGRLLGFVGANGSLSVAHCDDYGSVIAICQCDGTVLYKANFGPHGEDYGLTGSSPTPFTWLGGYGVRKIGDWEGFGIVYMTRYRLYSTLQQRFLASDPMGLEGGLNLYAYANGNPVAYIDPLGLCAGWQDAFANFRGAAGNYFANASVSPFDGVHSGSGSLGPIGVNIGTNEKGDVILGGSAGVSLSYLPGSVSASSSYLSEGGYVNIAAGGGVQGGLSFDKHSPSADLSVNVGDLASASIGYNVNLTHPSKESAQVIGAALTSGAPNAGAAIGGVIYDVVDPYYERYVSPHVHW